MNANLGALHQIITDTVVTSVIHKKAFAFAAWHLIFRLGPNVNDPVIFDLTVNDVVKQHAIIFAVTADIVLYLQIAGIHHGVARTGVKRRVMGNDIVVGIHIVNAIA